jgi:phosphate transport system substrate-binding protein
MKSKDPLARRVSRSETRATKLIEYEFAKRLGLPMATRFNKAGQPVAPPLNRVSRGLTAVAEIPADLRAFIPDPEGANAYPIVTYTWVLPNEHYQDPTTAVALKDVLGWGLREGQTIAPELGYIPLPQSMAAKATEALDRVH